MSINFDELPKEKPEGLDDALPEEGFHGATVEKAEFKTSAAGNEMIGLQLKLDNGGMVFDNLMLMEKAALKYKLSRFVQACKIPLTGSLEPDDLAKVVVGKRIVVDVNHYENEYKGETTTRAGVEIFKNDIFYPIEELEALTGQVSPEEAPSEDTTDSVY